MTLPTGPETTSRPGLTLLELILVMALALIILAAAAPRLNAFSRGQVLQCQADALLALLHAGRDRAAAEGATYRVEIDEKAGTFRLLRQKRGVFELTSDASGREYRLPEGFSIELERLDGEGDGTAVDFAPTGSCTPAQITLQDGHDHALYLIAQTPLESFVISDEPQEEGQ